MTSVESPNASPRKPSRAARIWQRTVVGTGLAAVVGGLLWASYFPAGVWIALVAALVLTLGGAHEAGRVGLFGQARMAWGPALACVAALVVWWAALMPSGPLFLSQLDGAGRYFASLGLASLASLGVLLAVFVSLRVRGDENERRTMSWMLFWGLWIALPLTGFFPIRLYAGANGLVTLVLLSKIGDVVGYYVGSWIGKSHPFPSISPGKTTAGCVGSLVAGTLFGYACMGLGLLPDARYGVLSALLAGAFINVASQAGDLLESVAKRRMGVKDSGRLFGPSGGVLDVVDSLQLSIPAALLTWPALFYLPLAGVGQ